jgi:hypothetical protein
VLSWPIWTSETQVMVKRKVNKQFDSQPLKVRSRLDSLTCRWRATYHWKSIDEGYNFALDFISIGGLFRKLCAPKVVRVPTLGISRLPLGSLETKCHLDVGPMARHKVYYKGEGDGFSQVRAMVSLMRLSLPVARPNTKSAPTMHTSTCCLVLCKSMWMSDRLSFFLLPS